MLKKAPAYRQAGIYPALRGIALILALLDEEGYLFERGTRDSVSRKDGKWTRVLSNRASHCGVNFVGNGFKPFPTKDFGRPRKRDFAKLNSHLGIFEHPAKNDFFNTLLKSIMEFRSLEFLKFFRFNLLSIPKSLNLI